MAILQNWGMRCLLATRAGAVEQHNILFFNFIKKSNIFMGIQNAPLTYMKILVLPMWKITPLHDNNDKEWQVNICTVC